MDIVDYFVQPAPREERMNVDHEPSDDEEAVLDVLKEEPGGRANAMLLREKSDLPKQRVNTALNQLVAAGWVERVTRGLYDLVEDPRGENE